MTAHLAFSILLMLLGILSLGVAMERLLNRAPRRATEEEAPGPISLEDVLRAEAEEKDAAARRRISCWCGKRHRAGSKAHARGA